MSDFEIQDSALVGVVTNKPPCLLTICLKVVGDNTNNGESLTHFRTKLKASTRLHRYSKQKWPPFRPCWCCHQQAAMLAYYLSKGCW
jgi:hypothetical protein